MTIMVAPLGVVAAIYLFEYAQNTITTRIHKIAVVNLAWGFHLLFLGCLDWASLFTLLAVVIDNAFYIMSLPNTF